MNHITDNHDALLDYLYEEGDPAERLMIATHLQECAPCAVAVLEFQSVRGMLRDWTPPLGFPAVKDASVSAPQSHGARSGWWRGSVQAAAAVLLFASGMAVSQLGVQYRNGSLTLSTGPRAPEESVTSINKSITLAPETVNPADTIDSAPFDNGGTIRDLRDRLQNASAPVDTELLLQRVRAMIDQSEQRQQRQLALRVSQMAREVETQHQVDVQRIEQNIGQQQDATMEYLVRTSGGAK